MLVLKKSRLVFSTSIYALITSLAIPRRLKSKKRWPSNASSSRLSSVIAFGDNYNDIELLQHVGMGIAVANAREEVKAVAREVTLESKNDGVAHAILKHILDKA